MYEEYFGLKRPPFRITPDTSLFYDGGQRGDILGALVYAIHRGEGIVKVVGEVGSGKTMLCRMLQLKLPDSVEIIYIGNPSVSPDDILFVIANELHFDIGRDASRHEVESMLQQYLLKKHAENRQVVLFIEEAQGMPLETLEEIRLLTNLETDQHKLLQIVLFGQPELDHNLAKNSIRQLRERITHDFQLAPLSSDQIYNYLNFRMREVGYTGPELISDKIARKMATHSEGLLRRINILADKMLLSAFADSTHTITDKHLKDAVKDSGFMPIQKSLTSGWMMGFFGLLLLAAIAYVIGQNNHYFPGSFKAIEKNISDSMAMPKKSTKTPASESLDIEVVPEPTLKKLAENRVQEQEIEAEQPEILQHQDSESTAIRSVNEPVVEPKTRVAEAEVLTEAKKTRQNDNKLDKVVENQAEEVLSSGIKSASHSEWLDNKIESSKEWLRNADKNGVSMQVMVRRKSAGRELVTYLQNEWPLDLSKTYLYEVTIKDRPIYRIFYNEYPTITQGRKELKRLPESVRVNSPYLHSIHRMQKALL